MVRFLCGHTETEGELPQPPVPITDAEAKEIFRKLDLNGDGVICRNELKKAFKDRGACVLWDSYRARGGLKYADRNKNGVIDEDEFEDFVKYLLNHGYKVK